MILSSRFLGLIAGAFLGVMAIALPVLADSQPATEAPKVSAAPSEKLAADSTDRDEIIPGPDSFIPMEIPPQPFPDNPQPKCPQTALTDGITAKVMCQVYVNKSGIVRKWKIVKVEPKGLHFEEAVETAIQDWKFTPATQKGDPVGVWVSIPFKFHCKEKQ